MHKDAGKRNRRAMNQSGKTLRTLMTAFCAGLALLAGCAPAARPAPVSAGLDRLGTVAILPIANLSNAPAPLGEIQQSFSDKLKGQGLNVLDAGDAERAMERIRMRDTSGLSLAG